MNLNGWGALGVAEFELRRSVAPARLTAWAVIAAFPVLLAALMRVQMLVGADVGRTGIEPSYFLLFFLVVQVTTLMGLLLWASPVVSAELEGNTWVYAGTRPGGAVGLVLGKYAVAVLWTLTAACVAAGLSVAVSGLTPEVRLSVVLMTLAALACMAYGALFTLIGTWFPRRAMVVAVIYTITIEGAMSLVPATINRFTVGFRLRALLIEWMEIPITGTAEQVRMMVGDQSTGTHLAVLAGYTALLLGLAVARVRFGEYPTHVEQ